MSKRAKIFFTLIVITLVLLTIFILVGGDSEKEKAPITVKPPSKVSIVGDGGLRNLLLDRQVPVVEQGISDYIRSNIGNTVKNASIASKPKVASDGLVEFTVETDNPKKLFKVTLDRTTYFDRVILKIPEGNYTVTLPVYQTNTGD
ncbi:hypothetical protein HY379_02690 [Candidatus Saccharibacteria bacterium]|nr:hypothetical protein [Candidatus Saccharibacteria bacterium]